MLRVNGASNHTESKNLFPLSRRFERYVWQIESSKFLLADWSAWHWSWTDIQAAEEAECDGGSTRQASRTTPSESTRIATLSWWCHNNIQRLTTFFLKQMQMKANEVSGLSVLSDCVKKLLKKYSCVGAWKPAYICKRPCCPYKKSHFQANSTGLFVWLLSLLLSCVSYVHCTNCSKLPWKA